jgi:hypothetical protein
MTDLKVIDSKGGHTWAFIQLEPDICDLVRAAELAELAQDSGDSGLLIFAVGQFHKMADDLKRKYFELWKA